VPIRGVYAHDYYFQLLYRPVTKEIVQLLQGQQFAFGNQVFSTTSFIRLITAIVEDCLGTGSTGSVGVVLSSFTGRISVKILHFRIFLVAHNVNYSSMWNVERKKVYKGTGNQGTEKRPEKKSGWRLGNVLSTTQDLPEKSLSFSALPPCNSITLLHLYSTPYAQPWTRCTRMVTQALAHVVTYSSICAARKFG